MQISGIKSFIFSFILTISAVIAVDKYVLHAPKTPEEPKKISYKNIVLFSEEKSNETMVVASATMSAEKIVEEPIEIAVEIPLDQPVETKDEPVVAEVLFAPENENIEEIAQTEKEEISIAEADIPEDEMSFEELMAMNGLSADGEATVLEQPQDVAKAEVPVNDASEKKDLMLADTSFDENINLWLPLEKSVAPANIATDTEKNQVALSGPDVMLKSIIDTDSAKISKSETKASEEEKIVINEGDKKQDSPWVVAKGAKFAKNRKATVHSDSANVIDEKENMAEVAPELQGYLRPIKDDAEKISNALNAKVEAKPEGSVDVAYKVMQNILIPIPEEILKDDNLTPQLVSSDEEPKEESSEETSEGENEEGEEESVSSAESEGEGEGGEEAKTEKGTSNVLDDDEPENVEEEKQGFFKKLGSLFSSAKKKKKAADESLEEYDLYPEGKADKVSKKKSSSKKKKKVKSSSGVDLIEVDEIPEIMPSEIRLSFQPNKAEISGSTLRWLRAFADNAAKNDNVYLEIRIDGSNTFALQQKRLSLLHRIFLENGVPPQKIDTVFTSREPNSFVIRSIKFSETTEGETNKKRMPTYHQSW